MRPRTTGKATATLPFMAFDFKRIIQREAEGKAIPAHPALMDRYTPTSIYSPGQTGSRRPVLTQREARRHIDAYGGNQTIDWVVDCVRLYQDTAAGAAWHLESDSKRMIEKRTQDSPSGSPLAPPELIRLLKEPNPFMDYSELIELLVIDLLLVGNAYWLKFGMTADGKPLALYRLHPAYIHIEPGEFGVDNYKWHPPNAEEPVEFNPLEILHFKLPNPHSAYYGMGVIKGGGRPLDLELALSDSQASYFENKAEPSMIVQSERRVPRDVFNKMRAQIRARSMGTDKTGDLLVLESGLKASTLTPNARDAMYAELGDKSRDRIFSMFRVHPKLLGLTPAGTGDDKIQDVRREFDNKTMRPFLNRLQGCVARGLTSAWDLDFKIDYRYVMSAEDAIKLSSDLGSVPGIMVKDVRGFLVEAGLLDEVSTGDNEIDELVLNLPGENLDANGQPPPGGGFADQPLPREAGRPPKGENTQAIPRNGNLPSGARARRPQAKAVTFDQVVERLNQLSTKAFNDSNVRTSVGNRLPGEQRPHDVGGTRRAADLDAIIGSLEHDLASAAHVLERGLLDHAEGKAFDPKSTVKRMRSSESWRAFRNLVVQAVEKAARQAISASAVGLGRQVDLDYDAIAAEIANRRDGVISAVGTLQDRILTKTEAKLDAGATLADLQTFLQQEMQAWVEGSAEVIATAEAVEAYNEGTLSVLEASGEAEVFVSDGEGCEDCKEIDGQVWPISQARANRKGHPGCRRAFLALE